MKEKVEEQSWNEKQNESEGIEKLFESKSESRQMSENGAEERSEIPRRLELSYGRKDPGSWKFFSGEEKTEGGERFSEVGDEEIEWDENFLGEELEALCFRSFLKSQLRCVSYKERQEVKRMNEELAKKKKPSESRRQFFDAIFSLLTRSPMHFSSWKKSDKKRRNNLILESGFNLERFQRDTNPGFSR